MASTRNGLRRDLAQFMLPKGLLAAAGVESDDDFDEIPEQDQVIKSDEDKGNEKGEK